MRRRFIKLCVFLTLGAILNVMVAWGVFAEDGRFNLSLLSGFDSVGAMAACKPGGNTYPGTSQFTWSYCSFDYLVHVRELAGFDATRDPGWKATIHGRIRSTMTVGWPLRSLRGTFEDGDEYTRQRQLQRVIYTVRHPVNPGFAINTVFYAAVLWVLLALPGAVRRFVRRRRGRCTRCGYDLRATTTGVCPECGGPVTVRPAIE
jgi:hypothetical protein